MLEMLIGVWLFLIGAIFGSYAVATVWRLRSRELSTVRSADLSTADQKEHQQLIKRARLDKVTIATDHSRCLHCQHRLAWFDLIPIISWLSLKGRCRYCNKSIGWTEFLTEVILGGLFAMSYVVYRGNWLELVIWLALLVVLTILFIYDAKWQLLPTKILWVAIGLAMMLAVVNVTNQLQAGVVSKTLIIHYLGAVSLLSGLYWLLAMISRESWVGMGDAYVGAVVALVLGNFWLASVALFLANLSGCILVVIKAILSKKSIRRMRIAFGPMFIGALIAVYFLKVLIFQKISWMMFDI